MFSTTIVTLCFTFLNFFVLVRCAPELPAEDSYGIIGTEWTIRNTVNNLFSTLKLKVLQQKLKLKQYSTIHNFFASITLRDHDNLKKIAKLTHVDNIDNGTQVFITQLNEVLNEDSKSDEATDSVYVTILIEDFISRLDNLKETNDVKNNTKFDLNKAILRYFSNNENEFGNTTYLSKEFVKGNASDDYVLSSNEFWQPSGRRIFWGKSSTINSFPFMASVQFFKKFQCGGFIIKSDLVITSASCVQISWNNRFFRENPAFLSVQVGTTYYERGGENIPVVEIEYHPGFNPKNLKHNLALMRLTRTLKFREKKRNLKKIDFDRHPWPLPTNTDGIVVVGWGSKTLGNQVEANWKKELSYSRLDIYPLEECQEIYTKEFVTDRNFCAGFFSKGGGACNHDAGGPGVSSGILMGVISFGSPQCGTPDAPTVFTKLGYYTDWIEEIMEKKTLTGRQQTTLRPPNYDPTLAPITTTVPFRITPIVREVTQIPESDVLRTNDKKHDVKQFLKTIFKKNKQPKKQRVQQYKQIKQEDTTTHTKTQREKEEKRQGEEERKEENERQKEQQDEEELQEEEEKQQKELQEEEEEERQQEGEKLHEEEEEGRLQEVEYLQEEEEIQQEGEELQEDEEELQEEERQKEEEIEEVTEKEVDKTQDSNKMEKVKPKQASRSKPETKIKKEDKLLSTKTNKKSKCKEKMARTPESQNHSEEKWSDKTATIRPCTIFVNKANVTILNDNSDASSADIASYEKLIPSFKQVNDGNKEVSPDQEKEFDENIDSILDTLNINFNLESKERLSVDQQRMMTKDLKSNTNLTDVSKKKAKKSITVVENIDGNEESKSEDGHNEYENNEQSGSDNKSVEICDKSPSADNPSNDNPKKKHCEEGLHTVNKDNEIKDYETDDGGETDEEFETLNIPAKPFEQENSSSNNNNTDKLLDMLDYEDLYKLLSDKIRYLFCKYGYKHGDIKNNIISNSHI